MITLETYFDKMFVINLAHRTDRMRHFNSEMARHGVPVERIERFDAYHTPQHGIVGATKSHRAVIRQVAAGPWERVLIFEDDAEPLTLNKLKEGGFKPDQQVWKTFCSVLGGYGTLQNRFGYLARYMPDKWDMFWLTGGYGDKPISRVNKHVIRFRYMKNCAAYGITRDFARWWTKWIDATVGEETSGAVDDMFWEHADSFSYYIFQPRLMFTGKTKSDVNGQENSYLFQMTDPVAENMV